MTRIREANKQYNIHIVHITYLFPLLKFGKRKVFTVRKLVSCDVDKVMGITIFVRKKVGGIDPTHPPGFGAYVHQSTKFRPNRATRGALMTLYTFSRWRPRRLHTTSGFVFDDAALIRRSKSICKPNFVDIS